MSTATSNGASAGDVQLLEQTFRKAGFAEAEAYRLSFASVRLRIRDERFRGLSRVARMKLVEPIIDTLSEEVQQDLIFVLPIACGEETSSHFRRLNEKFERQKLNPE
ncbi:MAG: hypothetical protein SFV23_08215 [Planctomycetaceae bacterium]|nr:hypothetical protein [Planctomycetaceae bacterium]